jgi:hypothetical protein
VTLWGASSSIEAAMERVSVIALPGQIQVLDKVLIPPITSGLFRRPARPSSCPSSWPMAIRVGSPRYHYN